MQIFEVSRQILAFNTKKRSQVPVQRGIEECFMDSEKQPNVIESFEHSKIRGMLPSFFIISETQCFRQQIDLPIPGI